MPDRRDSPRWLWRPVERKIVHTMHGHLLEGMRRHAEQHPIPDMPRQHDPYLRPPLPDLVVSYDYIDATEIDEGDSFD